MRQSSWIYLYSPTILELIVDWRENAFASYILPGAAGRFLGFWACCCQAIFSYVGTEIIGIAADETERQRETLPKAVRRVSYRLSFYYIGAIVVLGLNVSSTDPVLVNSLTTSSYFSPFVLMVERAGIPGLAHVINAVALIAVLSVANANLYVSVFPFHPHLIDRAVPCMPSQGKVMVQESLKRNTEMSLSSQ